MNAVESVAWLDSPHALDATVERVKQVKSLGLDVGLDFHGRLHKTLAKQLARALEPHKPLFIEEPLLPGHVPEMKTLYEQTTIPVAVGRRQSFVSIGTDEPTLHSLESDCLPARTAVLTLRLAVLM